MQLLMRWPATNNYDSVARGSQLLPYQRAERHACLSSDDGGRVTFPGRTGNEMNQTVISSRAC